MASDDSFEEDNPFGGLPFFGDLGKLFNHGGPIAWDVARQFAYQIATEGEAEPNVDPLDRIKLNELARVAELRVADITSLGAGFSDQAVSITATTRSEWASKTLDAYQPLLERLAGRLAKGTESTDVTEPEMQMLDGLMRAMNPMMMAMSAGSIAGHLATKAFGNYELPIPRPNAQLLVVIANVDLFASEWSLPRDDVWLWVCINELATQSVMNVTHVRNEFDRLLNGYIDGFETSPQGLENRFMDLDIGSGDPAELQAKLQNALSDPENLLGAVRSDAQSALIPDLNALLCVVVGYVDYVVEKVSRQLLESYESLSEVAKRRRFSASPGDRFVEKLLGVEVTPELLTRGTEFISGVIDRAGDSALSRLWTESDALPTPNELDAPGLWLARIDLPNLDSD